MVKDWRTDRNLRRLEAMMAAADKTHSYTLTGNGDVLEPDGTIAIGSGGNSAAAATRELMTTIGLSDEEIGSSAKPWVRGRKPPMDIMAISMAGVMVPTNTSANNANMKVPGPTTRSDVRTPNQHP